MKIYAPSYYKNFHCIADRCRHTCCAGWDVDIDEESLEKYRSMTGGFADHLKECIDFVKEPHFILTAKERCPLLNDDDLCELILHEGEDALCQICRDHPRFRNFWTGRTEIGLGMACEEAARLILTQKEALRLELMEDTDEGERGALPPDAAAETDEGGSGELPENGQDDPDIAELPEDGQDHPDIAELPEDEQYLMEVRDQLLADAAAATERFKKPDGENPLARLAEYLIYRHIADALYDDRLEERIVFVENTFNELAARWTDGKTESLAEIVRCWSAEYEYDTDKINEMLEQISSAAETGGGLNI